MLDSFLYLSYHPAYDTPPPKKRGILGQLLLCSYYHSIFGISLKPPSVLSDSPSALIMEK